MASLTRWALGAALLGAMTGCWTPQETRGANEAIAIYRSRPIVRASAPGTTRDTSTGDAAGELTLSVDAAVQLAQKSSARLKEMERRIAVTEAAVEAAGQRANPELRVTNVRVARAIDTGEPLSATPRLRFSPERIGEIPAKQAEARAATREARALLRAEEIAIESEIRWLFDEIVLLDAEIAAADKMAAARRRHATQAQEQLGTATATAIDTSLADLLAVEADAHVAERKSRRALALGELVDRAGLPPGTTPRLEGNPTAWPPAPLPPEETLIETALRGSPDIAGAAARIDGANARVHLEQTQRWPWFRFLEVGYEFGPTGTNVPLFTVGASVELPIFSANAGGIRRAEAANDAAKRRLESEVQKTTRDVRGRLREANAAAALVADFRRAAIPVLERAGNETARALETGGTNTLRALDVEERRCKVEIELLTLVRRYRTAVDALRRAVGGPLVSKVAQGAEGGSK
jgi:outer membrane protein TolC